jgi:hypothetical protein
MSKNSTNGQDIIEDRYDNKVLCQADINFGPATITDATGIFSKQPITVTVGVYDAGNNEIMFPSKGYYKIHFEFKGDTELLQQNYLRIQLFNSFTNSDLENVRYHPFGGSGNLPYGSATFYHWCNDTRDRIQVRMRNTYALNYITNVQFLLNSRVVRLLDYGY